MPAAVKYLVDESGQRTSVLVSVKVWEELNDNYRKLQNKLAVFRGIQEGLREVKRAKKSGKELQTLRDFFG